ncbi:hypothetical protein C8R47DRAFT_1122152 [Mycena vitilis]|nr:hypothetical protein C8R47DRAFT_1122152 [Mycena vitilis]
MLQALLARQNEPPTSLPSAHNWEDSCVRAKETIERHLEAYEEHRTKRLRGAVTVDEVPRLVDLIAHRLAVGDARTIKETLADVPPVILQNNIWRWYAIPYPVLRQTLLRLFHDVAKEGGGSAEFAADVHTNIDEWIFSNEKWLRDGNPVQWRHGLVSLDDAEHVFLDYILTKSERTITRPGPLPGFELLCEARAAKISIQPSTAMFKRNFYRMSDGLLQNLDWSNVLVAGGIILGTLLSSDSSSTHLQDWRSSDIDMYIHGLSPEDANKKIQHVFDAFSSNLPPGTRTFVVRNMKTITFHAKYPLRRIQIVLKLVESPLEVLLNFDLDICAMGWDGSNVWMLPRAARALEIGSSVFTMDLVRGHYLSTRRASQPQRVFKYANRGYGIRFLPSYMAALQRVLQVPESGGPPVPLDMAGIADDTRRWIDRWLAKSVHYPLHMYTITPRSLPGYSLSGFAMFMRHVSLWEMGQCRRLNVRDDWGPGASSYEERTEAATSPDSEYPWNTGFSFTGYRAHINQLNAAEVEKWVRFDHLERLIQHGVTSSAQISDAVQRIACAPTLDILLHSGFDISLPVILPCDFAVYANDLVSQAQAAAGLKETKLLEPAVRGFFNPLGSRGMDKEGLFFWGVGRELMWQQLDRRIDEVFEALHAFRRANTEVDEERQASCLLVELSKRELRGEESDEFLAFVQWVGKEPIRLVIMTEQDQ